MHFGEARAYVNMHAQTENAGDALVLRELVKLVSSRVRTDVLLDNWPDSFVSQLDLTANASAVGRRGRPTVTILREMVQLRLRGRQVYYFLTAGAPNGERSIKQFATDLVRIGWLAFLTVLGVRICQVGVSFERIGPRHARVLRWRSRFLYASIPRDRITLDYMRQLGIRATGLMPDVTVNMFMTPRTSPNEGARHGTAFSFRIDKYPEFRGVYSRIVARVCADASVGDELIFVAQVARDVPFMRDLAALASEIRPGQVRFVECHDDIDLAFATYRTCDTVLSNRLHALLPSLKEGATPVAVIIPELDPKISGVFDSLGLGNVVFDVQKASPSEIKTWMDPIVFDGRAAAEELNAVFEDLLLPRCAQD